jgi:hypothetical protein
MESGWITSGISVQWLELFIATVKPPKEKKVPIVQTISNQATARESRWKSCKRCNRHE